MKIRNIKKKYLTNPWKILTILFGGIFIVVIGITVPISYYIISNLHLLPGFDRLIVEGKHRRPFDSLIKTIEQILPEDSVPLPLENDSLLQVYQIKISPKEIAAIDDELVILENKWGKLSWSQIKELEITHWHSIDFEAPHFSTKAKLSLRGSFGHWFYTKKSWRLKFKKNTPFERMHQTHLIIPYDRAWIADYLFNRLASRYGIMTLKDGFVILYINGIKQGLYYQIEHPGENLLARNGRQEGPIIRHEGDGRFESYIDQPPILVENINVFLNQAQKKVLDAENIKKRVNVEKYIPMLALARLFGTDHWTLNSPDNLRLYLDPTTGLLEPIPWDTFCYPYELRFPGDILDPISSDEISRALLIDSEIQFLRNQVLWELVGPALDNILAEYDQIANHLLPYIENDYLKRYSSSYAIWEVKERYRKHIKNNALFFREILSRNEVEVVLDQHDGDIHGELINWSYVPVELVSIYKEGEIEEVLPKKLFFWSYRNSFLKIKGEKQDFVLPITLNINDIQFLKFRNAITKEEFLVRIKLAKKYPEVYVVDKDNKLPIGWIRSNEGWELGPGELLVDKTLMIPSGQKIIINPGTTLSFQKGASLITRSPVEVVGNEQQPIMINLPDSSGVFAIIEASEISHFRNVYFQGGEDAQVGNLYFSGALSLFYSPAVIRECRFENTRAEDAVSVKYSQITIENCFFHDNPSDALDLDWCKGIIRNSLFSKSLGDHIDISGSEIEIKGNVLVGAKDKGISVGEKSKPEIIGNLILSDSIGVAVKDESFAVLSKNWLFHNHIGLASYIKKHIFGPPTTIIDSCWFYDNDSTLTSIDGKLNGQPTLSWDIDTDNEEIKRINSIAEKWMREMSSSKDSSIYKETQVVLQDSILWKLEDSHHE